MSQLKQVSRIKQKLKNNLKMFVVNLICGALSLYARFFLGFCDNPVRRYSLKQDDKNSSLFNEFVCKLALFWH
jgi:hypothetical protein